MDIFSVLYNVFTSFESFPLLVPLAAVLVGFSVVMLIKKVVHF